MICFTPWFFILSYYVQIDRTMDDVKVVEALGSHIEYTSLFVCISLFRTYNMALKKKWAVKIQSIYKMSIIVLISTLSKRIQLYVSLY